MAGLGLERDYPGQQAFPGGEGAIFLAPIKDFLSKWRLKCRAVADSLEEAGEQFFCFTSLNPAQWKSGSPLTPSNASMKNYDNRSRHRPSSPLPRPCPCSSGLCCLMNKVDG